MPSESEVREAVELAKRIDHLTADQYYKMVDTLRILAESWLGRKYYPEKVITTDGKNSSYERGWNKAIDYCRLASVVSEERRPA